MTTVMLALKTGGVYWPEHVSRLCRQVRRFSPEGTRVTCLTDAGGVEGPDEVIRPEPFWPSWWCKLCCLEHHGPVLYIDLDTTITDDIAPLLEVAERHDLVMWRAPLNSRSAAGSGLMAWRGDLSPILEAFLADPARHMKTYSRPRKHGDQDWIFHNSLVVVEFWQDLLPGMVLSHKADARADWSNCRVKLYHGHPKPWDVGE